MGIGEPLRAALAAARRRGLVTSNPAEGRMDSIPDDSGDDDLHVWEPSETARFLEHVASDRLSVLYELAAYGGLRRAELCGLRWSDVDEDGAGVEIRQTIVELTRAPRGSPLPSLWHGARRSIIQAAQVARGPALDSARAASPGGPRRTPAGAG